MIGLFSDIHGHRPALEKTLRLLRREGAQHLYCLGDLVGYIPDTQPVRIVRDNTDICLRGNHELMLDKPPSNPEQLNAYKTQLILEQLSSEERAYLSGLPFSHRETFPCGWALFVHGNPKDPANGYIYPDTDLEPFCDVDADFIFMGHTHRPFIREAGGKLFINVGSCGLPRDHGGLGSAALFDEKTGCVRIVRFSIEAETQDMLAQALPLHESVINLFDRRPESWTGDIIDE